MSKAPDAPAGGIERLLAIMAALRDPHGGCPWDVAQTFATIAPYTIEEAYEVADAIARGDMADLKGELGDLLLQVVYHAQMATEAGAFDFDAVAHGIADKMIARHPHVFGPGAGRPPPPGFWEALKAQERAAKGAGTSALDDVALALPALTRALKLQKRAARVGFDWPDAAGPRAKVLEELAELDAAGADDEAEELGDLLFAVVNLARKRGIAPEEALCAANAKFERRFKAVERLAGVRGLVVEELGLDALDKLWDEVKRG